MHNSVSRLRLTSNDKVLILSDGKPGHLNQSIAFARLLDLEFEVREVLIRNRFCKTMSYLLDSIGVYSISLLKIKGDLPECSLVVSTGSNTYYANKVVSRTMDARSVAIMLPRSYRYDFDLIVAQHHDQPPPRKNILVLPVNLSFPEPKGFVSKIDDRPYVSIIIGGSSRHMQMDVGRLKKQLQKIYDLFPNAVFLATTSRRTPKEVETIIDNGPFYYKVIASKDPVNPIPDFLKFSDYVFVTEDSTSMISEAVSYGSACIEILPLGESLPSGKIGRMLERLERENLLHLFDGKTGTCNKKVNLKNELFEACR